MADWDNVYIRFKTPLGDETLATVNEAVKELDRDAPALDHNGLDRVSWRSGAYLLDHICALLHTAGFPNEFDYRSEFGCYSCHRDPSDWTPEPEWSNPDILVFGGGSERVSIEEAGSFLTRFGKFKFVRAEECSENPEKSSS